MSRVVNLRLPSTEVAQHCLAANISLSVLEELPDGGVRVVCSTIEGSDEVRTKFAKQIIREEPRRKLFRLARTLW